MNMIVKMCIIYSVIESVTHCWTIHSNYISIHFNFIDIILFHLESIRENLNDMAHYVVDVKIIKTHIQKTWNN